MSRPRLLLLDEPSLGLAPLLAQQIFGAIRELNTRDRPHRVPGRAERLPCAEARAPRLCHGQRRDHAVRHRPRAAGAARGARGLSRRRPPRGGRRLDKPHVRRYGSLEDQTENFMKLAHFARLAVVGAALLLAPLATAFAQTGTIRFIVGAARPAARSIPTPASSPSHMSKTLGQTDHRREQARRQRQHLRAVHRRPAGRRQHDLARHPGVHRDQSQRVQQSALVDRRLPSRSSAASRRRWCSSSIRACRPTTFAEFLAWAKAQPAASSAIRPIRPGTPSHFLGFQMNEKFDLDLTHVPYRRLRPAGQRRCSPAIRCSASRRSTSAPQLVQAGKLKALGITGTSATARCRTCRPSPSWAIRNSPPRSGSACWSRKARRPTSSSG